MLEVQFGEASDPRRVRGKENAAAGSIIPASREEVRWRGFLFALAQDADGAEFAGASATAITVLTSEFAHAQNGFMLISILPRLVQQAGALMRESPAPNGQHGCESGAALVACALRYDQAVVSHVGGARCYLVRGGCARPITHDQPPAPFLEPASPYSATPINKGEGNHLPSPRETMLPETAALTLQPEDVLALCTSGVHAGMNGAELAAIAGQRKSATEIARELVARGAARGGSGNAMAQVIRIRSVEQAGMHRGRTYRLAE
jgi:PPM family protein phosphatase